MKHIIPWVLMIFLSSSIVKASGDTIATASLPVKRWSFTVSTGYSFPFAKQVLGGDATVDNNSTAEGKLIRGTYGKGIFNLVSIGYKINPHLGAELGIHSTWGDKLEINKVCDLSTGAIFSQTSRQVSTNGMLVGFFITNTYSKFHISFHDDFLVGILNRATEENFSNAVKQPVWKYSGGISYGWLGRISASYDLTEKIDVGLSGYFLLHSWSPAQRENLNGSNKTTYTDTILSNGINSIASNQQSRITYPLHAVGVNIFAAYNF